MLGALCYELHEDPYAYLVHEIVEQMLSMKGAMTIYRRLESLCEGNVSPDSINALTNEQIRATGISGAKVSYIRNLTDAVESGALDFSSLPEMSDKEIIQQLTKVRGVGTWTAKMYLVFVLDRADVLPHEDVAFLQAYRWMYNTQDLKATLVQKKWQKMGPLFFCCRPIYVRSIG